MANTYYTFLIDTTAYSGNFEREMTAFITGEIGDCGKGNRFVDMYNEVEHDFDPSIVMQRPDEDHPEVLRPCAIAPTPGYVNNGYGKHAKIDSEEGKAFEHKWPAYQSVAIFFEEDPTKYIPFLKERAQGFADFYNVHGTYEWLDKPPQEQIKIISFRLERCAGWAETCRGEYV